MTKEELIQFEQEIADAYCAGQIRGPVHLSDGNEDQLIELFKGIKKSDWVFSTWRSHYHALLHGVPKEEVRAEIMKANSITLSFPEHRFFTSAIVNGITPIAVGAAMGIKRKGEDRHVWCFVGDMAAEAGVFYENVKYADNHGLPITFVVEDNGQSVGTPTDVVWGYDRSKEKPDYLKWDRKNLIYYRYEKKWPHVGAGVWVTF
ncbi:MAG TPA: thiamine pyrophosphate-dependent enzyme [Candidatus Paceibacterota bacterium]|nr:thiamine pyrophosphate-dependent enzyme [Candidatus Paceibacterota bacterium]